MIDEKQLDPVLAQVLGFMDEALAAEEANQVKIAELNQRLVQSERLLLEKVASAEKKALASVFPEADINHAVETLVKQRRLQPQDFSKVAEELRNDPASALTLLVKISEDTFPTEGMGIPRNTDPEAAFDPDGWTDMAAGRPVQLKAK